jgi:hypothetical protein
MNNFAHNEISDMATVSSIDFVFGEFTIIEFYKLVAKLRKYYRLFNFVSSSCVLLITSQNKPP